MLKNVPKKLIKKYQEQRKKHITEKFSKGHKCNEKSDIKKLYQYLN
jgi:hypothetical protein|tara:strand:- start:717 stop:854 length:138 start_codon:yes stop_codon:yes gene_type:complete